MRPAAVAQEVLVAVAEHVVGGGVHDAVDGTARVRQLRGDHVGRPRKAVVDVDEENDSQWRPADDKYGEDDEQRLGETNLLFSTRRPPHRVSERAEVAQ